MTDRKAGTVDIRRCLAMVIAVVMALTMFTGVTGVSHAATVSGAKATNYGFRMVRVSWKAVKVEVPQEPAEPETPEEPADPADPAVDPTTDPATDPNAQGGEPAVDPTVDPTVQGGEPAAEPAADPTVQGDEPAADPNGEPTSNPAAQSGGDPALMGDIVSAEPAAEPIADPVEEPIADPVEEPIADPVVEPAADPVVEPTADPAVIPQEKPAEEQPDDSALELLGETDPEPVYDVITYKVYRSTAKSGKYSLVKTTKKTSFINKGVKVGKRYYYKVIAYRSNGKKYGTSAIVSIKVAKKVTAKMTLLKKGNAAFNYRIAAKQKLYKYDTLQGACAHGGYAYLTLYNRNVEKCKIVKVKLSDMSVVKVSKVLPIYHGNNLSYNTKKKLIAVTCCSTLKKVKNRVVFVSPKTLKVVSTKNIDMSKPVKNMSKRVRKKDRGFTAIAYNEKHNCYVARVRKDENAVILNKNLKPLRYVKLKGKKKGMLVQGIETCGDYIYDVRSFQGKIKYCMVTVHTMSGKYVGQLKFPNKSAPYKELECIFHDGKQFYAGFYYSTVKVKGTKHYVDRINQLVKLDNL